MSESQVSKIERKVFLKANKAAKAAVLAVIKGSDLTRSQKRDLRRQTRKASAFARRKIKEM